jgi:ferritin-like metal-binding protein YciE
MENLTITTLHDLYDAELRKFTTAEVLLKDQLQDWRNSADSIKLKVALERYFDFIAIHIQQLQRFFDQEQISSLSLHNAVMEAFIAETNQKLVACKDAAVKDACLLASIQAINHFKISIYGSAAAFAKALGLVDAADMFHEAEVNEKQIDDRLSQLAEFEVNAKAIAPIVIP